MPDRSTSADRRRCRVGKINGNPIKSIYVYSRPEWTALVTMPNSPIHDVPDLRGNASQ
jgi:hypothetical protein